MRTTHVTKRAYFAAAAVLVCVALAAPLHAQQPVEAARRLGPLTPWGLELRAFILQSI
jgi:hypothetical protein